MGVGVVGLIFIFGWVVMLLWNWLMPDIFGLGQITYWQGWGLLLLSSILFKGFPSDSSDGGKRSDRRRKKELKKIMREDIFTPPTQNTKTSEENAHNPSGGQG